MEGSRQKASQTSEYKWDQGPVIFKASTKKVEYMQTKHKMTGKTEPTLPLIALVINTMATQWGTDSNLSPKHTSMSFTWNIG
jgi:hypothetical protein